MLDVPVIACVFIGICISHFMVVVNFINIVIVLLIIGLNASNSTDSSTAIDRVVNAASI